MVKGCWAHPWIGGPLQHGKWECHSTHRCCPTVVIAEVRQVCVHYYLPTCQLWRVPCHCASFCWIWCVALLKAEFKKDVASNHLNLHSNFYNVTHNPSKPVTEFINTVQSISHQLATIKHPLHATEITDMIHLHLHESFSPVRSALITCKEELTLTEIIAAVKEHEAHMAMTNCLPKGTSRTYPLKYLDLEHLHNLWLH